MTIMLKHLILLAGTAGSAFNLTYAADSYYIDPDSNAAAWVRQHPADSRAEAITKFIAEVPAARWFGDWNTDVGADVKKFVSAAISASRVPMLVAYNIPERDCGGASAGGANSESAYRNWIDKFAHAIGEKTAIVIVEPDGLSQVDCKKSQIDGHSRLDLLHYALSSLRLHAPSAQVYLDGGNAHWIPVKEMARLMDAGGIQEAKGFALNVSNFYSTQDSLAYANSLNTTLQDAYGYRKAVIIDTSRNGNGSLGQWCNPRGAKLGEMPHLISAQTLLGWIKNPGDSDGPCGAAPLLPAGVFSPDLAMHLIEGD